MKFRSFTLQYGTQLFKSFSDESRVRILYLLSTFGELCISDIEQVLDFTQTKTSRHVTYLKNSGLLNYRKYDQWIYYSLKEEVEQVINQFFVFLEKDNQLMEDHKNYHTLYSNNVLAIRKLHNKEKRYELPAL